MAARDIDVHVVPTREGAERGTLIHALNTACGFVPSLRAEEVQAQLRANVQALFTQGVAKSVTLSFYSCGKLMGKCTYDKPGERLECPIPEGRPGPSPVAAARAAAAAAPSTAFATPAPASSAKTGSSRP